jgi:hypothetical protein
MVKKFYDYDEACRFSDMVDGKIEFHNGFDKENNKYYEYWLVCF